MKINQVVAIDVQSKEKQIFTFGTAKQGKRATTTRGGKLNSYLEFCFKEGVECVKDVEVEFSVNEELFSLGRLHNEDGSLRSVLKKMVDGRWQVVARTRALPYIEEKLGEQLADMLSTDYVNNKSVANFHGDLLVFDQIKMLAEVKTGVEKSSAEAKAMRVNAMRKVMEYSANAPANTSTEMLDAINRGLESVSREIASASAQLSELKAKQNSDVLRLDIARELASTQDQYEKLTERKDDIDAARWQIKTRDDVETLIPRIHSLRIVAEQRAEHERKRYALTTELEWMENELVAINAQLEEKQRQYASTQDKRARIEAINTELAYIASLYEKNKKLNEELLDLNDRQERLVSEKVAYADKLDGVEKSVNEVKDSLDAFHIPAKSVGELLETVRVDVKIDEVTAQLEKAQSELAVKESQIAERESNLVMQVKRFRSVAELDVAVTPIKAKDTILQVLDAKHTKLETVNQSLAEKLRNLQRASEDYKFRILQLEQSRAKLEGQREKLLLRKQEEFKREVYLNSQKVFSDDASGVFAVTANFHDQEMDVLDQEIATRNMDRDLLMERAYQLEGSIKEIKRHMEINNAEMETLQREKANINKRYNEILAQNSNETVFNYLKALNSDNGTKYLLDVQQDAVRSEAELTELKRNAEALRSKIETLQSRLKYLRDTQRQLDTSRTSVDNLVSTNDRLKDELVDIGDRLTAGYEQYKAISRQMENIDSKLDDVRASIIETSKTIKVNEDQIVESTQKAQKYAGSTDLERAVANFRYELGDVESERQMLVDSKQTAEKDVMKKRIEAEKTQWLFQSKNDEYDELYRELQMELDLKGLDLDKITQMDLDSNLDGVRRLVADYDAMRASLLEKIQNLYGILQNRPVDTVTAKQISVMEEQLVALQGIQTELEKQRAEQMQQYVDANNARLKVTAAAAEAKTLSALKQTIAHNDIIGLLIRDKVRSILATATRFLGEFAKEDCLITEENYVIYITIGGQKLLYDQLTDEYKTAVYISLLLALPNTDVSEGKWLVFEERINIDKKVLADMLLGIDNVSYVVDFVKEQPRVREEAPEQTEEQPDEEQQPVADAAATVAE